MNSIVRVLQILSFGGFGRNDPIRTPIACTIACFIYIVDIVIENTLY
jgi:hypothetical protein